MNQRDFFNHYVKPYLDKRKFPDRPANRMLFHEAKDALHREGKITDWQVQNWVYPDTSAFLAPSEKRIVMKGRKRR